MRLSFLSVFAPILLLLTSCTPHRDAELAERALPIVNGAPDDSASSDAVVEIALSYDGGVQRCTGTLISERVVLTAAHCFVHNGKGPKSISVQFGPDAKNPKAKVLATRYLLHDNFSINAANHAFDIALVRLDNYAPEGVVPIPPLPESLALTGGDEGALVGFSGYGRTDPAVSSSTGKRQRRELPIRSVCTRGAECAASYPDQIVFDESEGGFCDGDSGGPGLMARGGRTYAAVIVSSKVDGCRTVGYATAVDAYGPMIQGFLAEKYEEEALCRGDDECASGWCSRDTERCAPSPCLEKAEGDLCDDEDDCTGQALCRSGACLAEPLFCDEAADYCQERCEQRPADDAGGCGAAPMALAPLWATLALAGLPLLRRRGGG